MAEIVMILGELCNFAGAYSGSLVSDTNSCWITLQRMPSWKPSSSCVSLNNAFATEPTLTTVDSNGRSICGDIRHPLLLLPSGEADDVWLDWMCPVCCESRFFLLASPPCARAKPPVSQPLHSHSRRLAIAYPIPDSQCCSREATSADFGLTYLRWRVQRLWECTNDQALGSPRHSSPYPLRSFSMILPTHYLLTRLAR